MSNSGLAGRDKEKKRMQIYYWWIRENRLFAQNRKKNKVNLKPEFHFGCSCPMVLYQTAAALQDPPSTASKGSTGKGRVQAGQKCHLRDHLHPKPAQLNMSKTPETSSTFPIYSSQMVAT